MKYFGSEEHRKNARKASLLGIEKIKIIRDNIATDYYINPNKCTQCSNILSYKKRKNKYCSSSCAATFNNKRRILSDKTKNLISIKLKGKKFTQEQKEKITGEKNGNWKGGVCRKKSITNRKCIICGLEFTVKTISNNRLSRSKCCSIEYQNKDSSNRMKQKANTGLLKGWSTRNVISYPEKFFINVLNNNNIKFKHNYQVNKRFL